jgi:hypothetical protein
MKETLTRDGIMGLVSETEPVEARILPQLYARKERSV